MGNVNIKGKKLLILGASAAEISLVKRAQQLGVYTIVSDYYTDRAISPAKDIADDYWDISWSDIPAITEKCKLEGIDGVCAGYSEFRVESQIRICEILGLPCYITMEQLDITRDKVKFKNACREAGVPVVKEFATPAEVDSFPVIVKPVDRGGSIGISVATNPEELQKAYEYAMDMSVCKQVIIEKYITGTKIDVYYEIRNGEITLLTSDDTINAASNGFEKVVQSSWLFPSKYHDIIVNKADTALRIMIKNMGITNGYIFISGFYDNGEIMFFETGFRLCGGHLYSYFEEKGSINNLDLFIYHALTGDTAAVKPLKPLNNNLKCVDINLYAKAGTIAKIEGQYDILRKEDCKLSLVTGYVGEKCEDDKAILNKIAMFYFCDEDSVKLKDDVDDAYRLFRVESAEGEDMIYDRIDTSVITDWWKN